MQWKGASPFGFEGVLIECETTAWSEFPYWGTVTVEQILGLTEINPK